MSLRRRNRFVERSELRNGHEFTIQSIDPGKFRIEFRDCIANEKETHPEIVSSSELVVFYRFCTGIHKRQTWHEAECFWTFGGLWPRYVDVFSCFHLTIR